MISFRLMAIRRTVRLPRVPLCSTASWHMPDVRPAASSWLDLEAVFCRESTSFCEIGVFGLARGLLRKSGYISGGFFDHGCVHIHIIPADPPRPPVLYRAALAALVELRKKTRGVFAVLEVCGVESRPVVVGDEAAVEMQVLIES